MALHINHTGTSIGRLLEVSPGRSQVVLIGSRLHVKQHTTGKVEVPFYHKVLASIGKIFSSGEDQAVENNSVKI